MFDIGWSEILVVAVVAIVVVGPKDLPRLLRSLGHWVRQARKMAREFQDGVEEFIREAELDDVKNSIHHVSNYDPEARGDTVIDPTGGAQALPEAKPDEETGAADGDEDGAGSDATPPKGATEDGKGDGG